MADLCAATTIAPLLVADDVSINNVVNAYET